MQHYLTIDRGNTALKAVVWDGETVIWQETVSNVSRTHLTEIKKNYNPVKVALCTVVANDYTLIGYLHQLFGEKNVLILSASTPLPIKILYSTPETLGSDRIAAAVGAWGVNPDSSSLIVDIGTAVTYDYVNKEGEFVGGNIAPGIGLRLKALNRFTGKLPMIDSRGETPLLGVSTETAMRSGVVNGIKAEILFYLSQLPSDTRLIITGGWGADIARMLEPVKATVIPGLVSSGLNRILLYNENK
ncbi:MAG: type III pantothenate kinase [Muribaculaceae bacterium]|nr:type III pantothenate kinase [Muribaculaceae bacterium]